ncbi:MFS transporter [Tumebacillus permanentifrigoris]|uniref:MFS transporter n=1 Tax=Tumebacillus permanentifrigoris TaxID=378543 RepID=A0A316D870_9BACL|nr:MFS transporter [Tumebacillus permanentifrigoris]PWK06280.1 MFS transporter [Tumebacillus permanentifrigoris]
MRPSVRPNWFSSALERRNFKGLTVDGALYFVALTFLDATILIPLFLQHVSGSPLLIGLATAIRHLCFVLPQVFIAKWMHRIPRLNRFVFRTYLFCRFGFLLVIGMLFFNSQSPWVLICFFIGHTLFCLGEGLIQVPWMDLFGRTIRPQNHGKLFGLMQTLGAVGSFAAGLLIQHVLSHPERFPYPLNFLIVFSMAFLLLTCSTLSFLYVREGVRRSEVPLEPEKKRSEPSQTLAATLRQNLPFRRLTLIQMLIGLHQLAMPFYILYVQEMPGVEMDLIGRLVIAQIVGGMVGGLLFGLLSEKFDNRTTIRWAVLTNVGVPILILYAGQQAGGVGQQSLVVLAFCLMGVVSGGWIGFTNYLLEISNDHTRGRLVAYLNMCTAPLSLLPVFSGSLLQAFSYENVFGIVLILLLVALFLSWKLPLTTIRHRRGERGVRSDRQTNAAPR